MKAEGLMRWNHESVCVTGGHWLRNHQVVVIGKLLITCELHTDHKSWSLQMGCESVLKSFLQLKTLKTPTRKIISRCALACVRAAVNRTYGKQNQIKSPSQRKETGLISFSSRILWLLWRKLHKPLTAPNNSNSTGLKCFKMTGL